MEVIRRRSLNTMHTSLSLIFAFLCIALGGCSDPSPGPGAKTAALIAALRSTEVAQGSSVEIDPPFTTGTWIISAPYVLEQNWANLGVPLSSSDRKSLFESNIAPEDILVIYLAPGAPIEAENIGGGFDVSPGSFVVKACCDRFRLSRPDAGKMVLIEGVAVPEKR